MRAQPRELGIGDLDGDATNSAALFHVLLELQVEAAVAREVNNVAIPVLRQPLNQIIQAGPLEDSHVLLADGGCDQVPLCLDFKRLASSLAQDEKHTQALRTVVCHAAG